MHETSPGVERALAAAAAWAGRAGVTEPRLTDFILGLLDEEEGRPADLLERANVNVANVRESLRLLTTSGPILPASHLLSVARGWSLQFRADPVVLTDAFLLAVLRADAAFRTAIRPLGLDPDPLETLLTSGVERPTVDATEPIAFALPDESATIDTARVLDVNFNRARESLRVLDDYCRFVLDDAVLTGHVKSLRHALAAASELLPKGLLLSARETLRDVGTTVTTEGEYDRQSPAQVASINLKRLQESFRSLEEFGKVFSPELGRQLESLRYGVYTLERAVVGGGESRQRLADARLYVLLTGSQCVAAMDWVIEQAAAGGANVFQLREKSLPDAEFIERARNVRRWTRKAGALFIVNDRPDIAKLSDADGVHLGQDDLSVKDARRILGHGPLIGISTHSLEQVRRAVLDGADYIGIGPTFPSSTKQFNAFPGLDFVRAASAETSLPAFALGGVGLSNVAQAVAAGAKRIAVSSALATAEDPEGVALLLRAALDSRPATSSAHSP
jgi:thiamine-phosphate pyrophosphorylase